MEMLQKTETISLARWKKTRKMEPGCDTTRMLRINTRGSIFVHRILDSVLRFSVGLKAVGDVYTSMALE